MTLWDLVLGWTLGIFMTLGVVYGKLVIEILNISSILGNKLSSSCPPAPTESTLIELDEILAQCREDLERLGQVLCQSKIITEPLLQSAQDTLQRVTCHPYYQYQLQHPEASMDKRLEAWRQLFHTWHVHHDVPLNQLSHVLGLRSTLFYKWMNRRRSSPTELSLAYLNQPQRISSSSFSNVWQQWATRLYQELYAHPAWKHILQRHCDTHLSSMFHQCTVMKLDLASKPNWAFSNWQTFEPRLANELACGFEITCDDPEPLLTIDLTVQTSSFSWSRLAFRLHMTLERASLRVYCPPTWQELGMLWLSFETLPNFNITINALSKDNPELSQLSQYLTQELEAELRSSWIFPHWSRMEVPLWSAFQPSPNALEGDMSEESWKDELVSLGMEQAGEMVGGMLGGMMGGTVGSKVVSKLGGHVAKYVASTVHPTSLSEEEEGLEEDGPKVFKRRPVEDIFAQAKSPTYSPKAAKVDVNLLFQHAKKHQ